MYNFKNHTIIVKANNSNFINFPSETTIMRMDILNNSSSTIGKIDIELVNGGILIKDANIFYNQSLTIDNTINIQKGNQIKISSNVDTSFHIQYMSHSTPVELALDELEDDKDITEERKLELEEMILTNV
jgi:hypothetical protein